MTVRSRHSTAFGSIDYQFLRIEWCKGQHTQQSHFKTPTIIRGKRHIFLTINANLIQELDIFFGHLVGNCQHLFLVALAVIDCVRNKLCNGNPVQHTQQIVQQC